jgi:hypothetical protein
VVGASGRPSHRAGRCSVQGLPLTVTSTGRAGR